MAVAYVFAAALGYSFMPVVIDWGGGGDSPFLFNAGWRCGFSAACLIFLMAVHRGALFSGAVWQVLAPRVLVWAMLFAVISHLDSTFFTLAIGFVDVSVAAILFETWPILMVLWIVFLFRKENRYDRNMLSVIPLMVVGFVGFAFVVLSQFGGFVAGKDALSLFVGVVFSVIGAGVSSLGAFTFRWGADASEALQNVSGIKDDADPYSLNMFGVVVGQTIANLVAAPVNASLGVTFGEEISGSSFLIAFVGGVVCNGFANILWRRANVVTTNLGINAIAYATPLFSLLWLALFWHIEVASVNFLIIGAMAVVTANLLINFEAEVRWGSKALVLSLWACGMIVYLRGDGMWVWSASASSYFEALALSATVFTLILSFRVARLVSRTRDEDNRTFILFRRLDRLAERGIVGAEVREHVLTISAADGTALQDAYKGARRCIVHGLRQASNAQDIDDLQSAEVELDSLVHSRMQGINFGELCSLCIFAGITVGLALCSRPPAEGLTGFLTEVFSMLFSAVIAFLTANVWDLQRDRSAGVLKRGSLGYGLVFGAGNERLFERVVSAMLGLGVAGGYAYLLAGKWLDWFG